MSTSPFAYLPNFRLSHDMCQTDVNKPTTLPEGCLSVKADAKGEDNPSTDPIEASPRLRPEALFDAKSLPGQERVRPCTSIEVDAFLTSLSRTPLPLPAFPVWDRHHVENFVDDVKLWTSMASTLTTRPIPEIERLARSYILLSGSAFHMTVGLLASGELESSAPPFCIFSFVGVHTPTHLDGLDLLEHIRLFVVGARDCCQLSI